MSSIKLISLDLDFARSNNKQIGILVGNDTIDNVLSILPDNDNIRYIILSNGTLIYDIRKDQVVYDMAIGNDEVLNYLELVKKEEVLVQAITYNEIIQERKDDIDYFNMPEKHKYKAFVPLLICGLTKLSWHPKIVANIFSSLYLPLS